MKLIGAINEVVGLKPKGNEMSRLGIAKAKK